jgi:hypothetical protein
VLSKIAMTSFNLYTPCLNLTLTRPKLCYLCKLARPARGGNVEGSGDSCNSQWSPSSSHCPLAVPVAYFLDCLFNFKFELCSRTFVAWMPFVGVVCPQHYPYYTTLVAQSTLLPLLHGYFLFQLHEYTIVFCYLCYVTSYSLQLAQRLEVLETNFQSATLDINRLCTHNRTLYMKQRSHTLETSYLCINIACIQCSANFQAMHAIKSMKILTSSFVQSYLFCIDNVVEKINMNFFG